MSKISLTEEQASKFCDEYCKYPLTTKTQFELDQVCHDCPMEVKEPEIDIEAVKAAAVESIHKEILGEGVIKISPNRMIYLECSNCGHTIEFIPVSHDAAVTNQAIDKCIELVRSRYWLTTEQLTEAMEKLKERKNG